jgi:hypothetical protein
MARLTDFHRQQAFGSSMLKSALMHSQASLPSSRTRSPRAEASPSMEARSSHTARYSSASLASSSRAWASCVLMLMPPVIEVGGVLGPGSGVRWSPDFGGLLRRQPPPRSRRRPSRRQPPWSTHMAGCSRRIEMANQRGGSEWEPIKNLLEGDRGSNKINTASNTRLRLNYPSWSRPHRHWSATNHRNQQLTFRAKTHQQAQRKLTRLAACATPVRPMACAGQTGGRTSQAGGYSRRTTNVPESLSDFSRPWNKNTPKTQPARKENPTQNQAKQHQTDQELTSNSTTQRHTD